MTSDELFFFNTKPEALPLYEALAERMLAAFPNAAVEVKRPKSPFGSGMALPLSLSVR